MNSPRNTEADVVIIGGGIVGLATAWALVQKQPGRSVVILEKEDQVAGHQTGRNSGVVHSGIYYAPGSLKAKLCRQGVALLKPFCREHGVRYDECGKVIVATSEAEVPALERLHERGQRNSVPELRMIGSEELAALEPHVRGVAALHSPATAITDYVGICRKLAELLPQRGARVITGAKVTEIDASGTDVHVSGPGFHVKANILINCAGLHSDRIARMSGAEPSVRIVPFRGEYFILKAEYRSLVKNLVYPVPNPDLPFLGVHFTRMFNGEVEAGPNAVFALAREGYTSGTISLKDTMESAAFRGFWRLAARYWRVGLYEMYRSMSKAAFVRSLQQLIPEITASALEPGPAGVRAQAVNSAGQLVDDFAFARTHNSLSVLNAPSPAATASLAIGQYVVEEAFRRPLAHKLN